MSTTATPVTFGRDASIARFSVAGYQRMIETGILTPDDKVELLENYVVLEMPRNPPHDGTIDLINAALPRVLPSGWLLQVHQTIVLSDSQPEPDFAVVRGVPRSFLAHHPGAADVGLVIEVADSSLLHDQRDKARIYARGRIPSYWIVNLPDARIEVYTQPSGLVDAPDYTAQQTYGPRDDVPIVLDGNTVASVPATELLP
jgi:Uma2 family endonuclease